MKTVQGKKNLLRALILAGGIVLLVSGLVAGDFEEVRQKAVMICMECIGLG